MQCGIHALDTLEDVRFVVVFTFVSDRLLLSRHRERKTWETQGGHIEEGETALQAASRELFEESGVRAQILHPVCDYLVEDERGASAGRVFTTQAATQPRELPPSEIAQTALFEGLPPLRQLTYPGITPILYAHIMKFLNGQTSGLPA